MSFYNALEIIWRLAYEVSPITLTGGLLSLFPGGALPILALTEPGIYGLGITAYAVASGKGIDEFLATWQPLPSGTLIDNQIGEYPFANQSVAANAIIVQPLRISMLMICPAKFTAGYFVRGAIIANMRQTIAQHVLAGGLFTVATPAYVYTDCVLLKIEDVSPTISLESPQPQIEWRWDFEQPLVTQQQAQQALNTQMSRISSGVPYNPNTGAFGASIGDPQSGIAQSIVPTSQPAVSSGVIGTDPLTPVQSFPLDNSTFNPTAAPSIP